MKKGIIFLLLISCTIKNQQCMEKDSKKHVFLDASCVLEPNKTERGKHIAQELYQSDSLCALGKLGVLFLKHFHSAREATIQKDFFTFLAQFETMQEYPPIIYEGETLPPIMVAWLVHELSSTQIEKMVSDHLESIPDTTMDPDKKALLNAMTHATFDSKIMQQTAKLTPKAKKFLIRFKDRIIPHLIGNLSEPLTFPIFEKRICISGKVKKASPSSAFFEAVEERFPGSPDERIYIVAEKEKARSGPYFDAARRFSHHIHRCNSSELEKLLK